MIETFGYAAAAHDAPLAPFRFERLEPKAGEVQIDILYCGVCHSDLHQARNEWHNTRYPCVPGHEIVGRVSRLGPGAGKFRVGDLVGVGCMVDSCRHCDPCKQGLEQYCEGPEGMLATYNGPGGPVGAAHYGVSNTFGGYSTSLVASEDFVLRMPTNLDIKAIAPLLCAGITTYSPMRHWKVGPGQKVGVVGLGGLGHMAVKIAKALGAHVTVFTSTEGKEADVRRLGADAAVLETDPGQMAQGLLSFDFIIDTVPTHHDINPYIKLLKRDATMVLVGALEPMDSVDNSQVAFHRRSVAGSLIGGIAETQEVLDFCAEHGIVSDVEMIRLDQINEAYERMMADDVRYRFVIDMASAKAELH